jgi:hypothetical protein
MIWNQSFGVMAPCAGKRLCRSVQDATHKYHSYQEATLIPMGSLHSEFGLESATNPTRTRTHLGDGIRIVATPGSRMKSRLWNSAAKSERLIGHTICGTHGVDILTDGMWGGRRKCPMTGCNNYIARQRRRPHRMCGRCTRLARGED